MGSDETAMATTGGPRVIAYLTVTGCYRAQIIYFFRMQIGPRTPSGTCMGSGSRLGRMRSYLSSPESSGSKTLGTCTGGPRTARSPQPPGGVNSNNHGSDPTPMHEATKENLLALIAESDDDEDAWAADLEEEMFS